MAVRSGVVAWVREVPIFQRHRLQCPCSFGHQLPTRPSLIFPFLKSSPSKRPPCSVVSATTSNPPCPPISILRFGCQPDQDQNPQTDRPYSSNSAIEAIKACVLSNTHDPIFPSFKVLLLEELGKR
ncbi:hypothetical protein Dimus_001437 [Dionaea muscipula]